MVVANWNEVPLPGKNRMITAIVMRATIGVEVSVVILVCIIMQTMLLSTNSVNNSHFLQHQFMVTFGLFRWPVHPQHSPLVVLKCMLMGNGEQFVMTTFLRWMPM